MTAGAGKRWSVVSSRWLRPNEVLLVDVAGTVGRAWASRRTPTRPWAGLMEGSCSPT